MHVLAEMTKISQTFARTAALSVRAQTPMTKFLKLSNERRAYPSVRAWLSMTNVSHAFAHAARLPMVALPSVTNTSYYCVRKARLSTRALPSMTKVSQTFARTECLALRAPMTKDF